MDDLGSGDSMPSSTMPSTLETSLSSGAELGDVESDFSQSGASEQRVFTMMDYLRQPQASTLARKRKVATNPPKGLKRSKGVTTNDPKSVCPSDRVKAYPNELFKVSNKKLFCSSCREELSLKRSSLDVHIKSSKHIKNKRKLKQKEEHELDIAEAVKDYQSKVHPKGETLPESTRVFRVKVVKAMLQAGIPIEKVDALRELFKETGYSLTDSSHLRELIPFISEQETSKLKKEISGKSISIVFDGTTHVCEALVIVIRYMDNWTIKPASVSINVVGQSTNRRRAS